VRAVDVGANIGPEGATITLPRLSVVVEVAQARRLRDALNAVLPEQIADLLHDPRVTDVDVLRAAQALLAERHQDTESLAVAIDHLERIGAAARQTAQPRVARTLRLLHLWGDVEPEISGPYETDQERLEAAQDYRRAHGDENGVFKLDVTGDAEADVLIESYAGGDLEMPKPSKWVSSAWVDGRNATVHENAAGRFELHVYETRGGRPERAGAAKFAHQGRAERAGATWTHNGEWDMSEAIRGCCLCQCEATGEAFGLPVCEYHGDHSEDDPRCPDCVPVHTGDRVRDPLDGTWRTVARLDLAENTAHMADGGCMSIDEAGKAEKLLPGEGVPS